ncbi:hypothetical protein H257_07602 [Aphanomyces astaci]|uniref:Secreted protein n=1 Tax=Aphanomyces astaci TaxID=112090 RepID=W4GIK0_APHAT|nr:hypothetical protein H257_07602 [Aphanomyces astaci]ETV78768.1 hypothetical protein H257_07602 [Aphanomyces astaci]|eukprot:XP_009831487.1 hypothetical protein H257_07602 [Aphanomyces astaci]
MPGGFAYLASPFVVGLVTLGECKQVDRACGDASVSQNRLEDSLLWRSSYPRAEYGIPRSRAMFDSPFTTLPYRTPIMLPPPIAQDI